ncbi:unnamed protein product [Calicophoron daubneyi]|uniref:DNA-binding protein SATB n=1 Tax=Calicophoron daubneyi TaxID=300641 RepID=A0AAV2TGT7_CALDB
MVSGTPEGNTQTSDHSAQSDSYLAFSIPRSARLNSSLKLTLKRTKRCSKKYKLLTTCHRKWGHMLRSTGFPPSLREREPISQLTPPRCSSAPGTTSFGSPLSCHLHAKVLTELQLQYSTLSGEVDGLKKQITDVQTAFTSFRDAILSLISSIASSQPNQSNKKKDTTAIPPVTSSDAMRTHLPTSSAHSHVHLMPSSGSTDELRSHHPQMSEHSATVEHSPVDSSGQILPPASKFGTGSPAKSTESSSVTNHDLSPAHMAPGRKVKQRVALESNVLTSKEDATQVQKTVIPTIPEENRTLRSSAASQNHENSASTSAPSLTEQSSVLPPVPPLLHALSFAADAKPADASVSGEDSSVLQPPGHERVVANSSGTRKPRKAPLPIEHPPIPPLTEEDINKLGELNTEEVAENVRTELRRSAISQRIFGAIVLGLSQGTVSELLGRPKPWSSLSSKGRESYIRMQLFLNNPEKTRELLASAAAQVSRQASTSPCGIRISSPHKTDAISDNSSGTNSTQVTQSEMERHITSTSDTNSQGGSSIGPDSRLLVLSPSGAGTFETGLPQPLISEKTPPIALAADLRPVVLSPSASYNTPPRNNAHDNSDHAEENVVRVSKMEEAECHPTNITVHEKLNKNPPMEKLMSMVEKVKEFDTAGVRSRVKKELRKHNISQRLFADVVLDMSQASFSDLLNKPRPWAHLKPKARLAFMLLDLWLKDANRVSSLKTHQNYVQSCVDDQSEPPFSSESAVCPHNVQPDPTPPAKFDGILPLALQHPQTEDDVNGVSLQSSEPADMVINSGRSSDFFNSHETIGSGLTNMPTFTVSESLNFSQYPPPQQPTNLGNGVKTRMKATRNLRSSDPMTGMVGNVIPPVHNFHPISPVLRSRSIFTEAQKSILFDAFARDPYPTSVKLRALSSELNLPHKTVLNWFQNHRIRSRGPSLPPKRLRSNSNVKRRSSDTASVTVLPSSVSETSFSVYFQPTVPDQQEQTKATSIASDPDNQLPQQNRRKRLHPVRLSLPSSDPADSSLVP